MTTGLERKPIQLRDLLLKTAFWMATFVTALALSAAQALAGSVGYVANGLDGTVSVINTSTNTQVATISTNGAAAIAVTPDGTRAYVVTAGGVSVIDTATNTVVGSPIPIGADLPGLFIGMAITPNGSRVYVANSASGTVSVIATASNKVVDTISVGTNPSGIAITPDGKYAYVADSNVARTGTDNVFVIDIATNTVVDTIPVGAVPVGIAITPDGARAYVANVVDPSISVVDIATNTVVDTIPLGVGPVGVAITPDGTQVYVVCILDPLAQTQSVSVIATASNTVVSSIPVGLRFPNSLYMGLAVTPDGTGVYVANSGGNTLSVISTASNTVTGSVTVGNAPVAVAFSPAILFSAFSAKLDISSDGFQLNGTFALGPGGTINPPAQALTLRIGTNTITVPAGSFKAGPHGTFTFQGTIGGVALQIRLAPAGSGTYSIQADASGVNLTGLTNPVAVTLSIGKNTGTTSVTGQSN